MAEVEINFVDAIVQFVLSFVIILVISAEVVHLDTYLAYSKTEGVSTSFGPFSPAQVI